MNDEFLYRLRVLPPSGFAARLKLRLDGLTSAEKRRRTYRRLYTIAGFFVAGTALALVGPAVRDYAIEWFGIELRSEDATATAPARTAVSPFTGRGVVRYDPPNEFYAESGSTSAGQLNSPNPLARSGQGHSVSDDTSNAPAAPSVPEETIGGALRVTAPITINGSSTVQPLTDAVVAKFTVLGINTVSAACKH